MEEKREFLDGELSDPTRVVLPVIAAVGMIIPATIYVAINWGGSMAMEDLAVPSVTEIVFVLGVPMLLGSRVPSTLKLSYLR